MPGDAAGRIPNRPYQQSGGFAIRHNGAAVGVRANVNLQDQLGLDWDVADDAGNNRVNIAPKVAGEVLLGSVSGLNHVAGFGTVDIVLGFSVQEIAITRIVFVGEDVTVVSVQPTVEAGTDAPGNPPNDDVAAAQALTLIVTDTADEMTLVSPRPILDQSAPNNILRLRQTVNATATTYLAGYQVFGVVLTQ